MTQELETRTARRRSMLRWLGSSAVVVAAGIFAHFAGRRAEPQAAPAAASAADSANAGRPQMVMLTPQQAHRIGVTYAPVTMDPVLREIRTVGQVSFDEQTVTDIAPKLDGWVDSLFVNFTGQTVHAGAPVLTIYAPMAVAAEEELLLARRLSDRVAGGSDDARAGAADLLASARRRLAYWDIPAGDVARIEASGVVKKTLTLYAPATGVVIQKSVVAGQRIMAGQSLYQLADLRTVWVQGEIFERDLPAVHVGQSVQATFEALPGAVRTGRITFIDPTVNAETRTVRVRVALANPSLDLKPGMYATLVAAVQPAAASLSIPRNAVLSTGERNIVFVKRPDGMLEPREVAIGLAGDDRVAVLRGLSMGDTVVASATFLVDAESNLGEAMGGMGGMPGMDMAPPAPAGASKSHDSAAMTSMPGMPGMAVPARRDSIHR